MARKSVVCAVAFAILASAFGMPEHGKAEAKPVRVLFIGNSYTQFNGMPLIVAELGRSLGYDIRPEVRAVGGTSFTYHARSAETRRIIAAEKWDVVVLQDYSLDPGLRPKDVRARSLPHARRLVRAIRQNDPATRIIYYATWGRRDGDEHHCLFYPKICTFDGHSEALQRGYRLYQAATGGDIAPVGANWQRVVHDDAAVRPFAPDALWLDDGSHPSRLGSYLAAATILRQIISAPVSASRYTAGLPPDTAAYLRRIVDAQ